MLPELNLRGRGIEGKPEMEGRPCTRLAFYPHLSFVRVHHVLHDLGAESSAAFLGAERSG